MVYRVVLPRRHLLGSGCVVAASDARPRPDVGTRGYVDQLTVSGVRAPVILAGRARVHRRDFGALADGRQAAVVSNRDGSRVGESTGGTLACFRVQNWT